MSVQEATAYSAQHEIAQRLTDAINAQLATLPADPYGAMVRLHT